MICSEHPLGLASLDAINLVFLQCSICDRLSSWSLTDKTYSIRWTIAGRIQKVSSDQPSVVVKTSLPSLRMNESNQSAFPRFRFASCMAKILVSQNQIKWIIFCDIRNRFPVGSRPPVFRGRVRTEDSHFECKTGSKTPISLTRCKYFFLNRSVRSS